MTQSFTSHRQTRHKVLPIPHCQITAKPELKMQTVAVTLDENDKVTKKRLLTGVNQSGRSSDSNAESTVVYRPEVQSLPYFRSEDHSCSEGDSQLSEGTPHKDHDMAADDQPAHDQARPTSETSPEGSLNSNKENQDQVAIPDAAAQGSYSSHFVNPQVACVSTNGPATFALSARITGDVCKYAIMLCKYAIMLCKYAIMLC